MRLVSERGQACETKNFRGIRQKLVERQHLQNFIELFQGLKCKATDKGIVNVSRSWQPTLT